jgi:hypothetical protein
LLRSARSHDREKADTPAMRNVTPSHNDRSCVNASGASGLAGRHAALL